MTQITLYLRRRPQAPRPVRLTSNTPRQLGFAGPRPIIVHHAVVSAPVAKPAVPRAPRQPLLRRARLVVRVACYTAALTAAVRNAHLAATACWQASCRHLPCGTTRHVQKQRHLRGLWATSHAPPEQERQRRCHTAVTQRCRRRRAWFSLASHTTAPCLRAQPAAIWG